MISRFIKNYLPVRSNSGIRVIPFTLLFILLILSVPVSVNCQSTDVTADRDSTVLNPDCSAIGVTVPAYTGAICISNKDFNRGLILNAEGLIAGRFQGLLSRLADGSPSAGYTLESLRNSSFYNSLSPLLVVDGVPVMGIPQLLNPHDIQSITWLSGSQAAGYGSLGRNGALLIETMKGHDGLHVTYSGQVALSTVKKYSVLTGDQVREALLELYPDDPEILALAGSFNTDWQDEIYRTAVTHDHHLGISGTAGKVPFRFSAGQTSASGTIRSSYYRKSSLTGRIDPSILDDNLKISLSASANFGKENSPGGSWLPYYAAVADPTSPVYENNDPAQGYKTGSMFINPVSMLESNESLSKPKQTSVYMTVDYSPDLLRGLRIGLKSAAIGFSDENRDVVNPGGALPIVNGSITTMDESLKTRSLDLSAGYATPVKSIDSEIELKAGYFMHWVGSEINELTTDYVNPEIIYFNSLSTFETSRSSVYGELKFSALRRYFLTAVLRDDSFSEYTPANRSVLSPSVTAEWNIAEEPFSPSGKFISDLALSFTLGSSGTGSMSQSSATTPSYGLRPESAQYFISGLRMAFFENSVRLSVNAFINKNQNMHAEVAVPSGSNFSSTVLVNAGDVDNKGIELRADANLFSGKKIEWNAALHMTVRKNIIENLPNGIDFISAGSVPLIPYVQVLVQDNGRPVNTFYLLKQVYNENGMPLQGFYEDTNNNGSFGYDDRYSGPSTDPEFAAGIWSSLKYRNWQFSFSASSLAGNWCYNVESAYGNYGSMTPSNTLRNISSLVYESGFTAMVPYSDYHIENGSFIRLDFVSLGHTFRNVSGKNVDFRLEATLQNAFMITGYRGADPDIHGGLTGYTWPRPHTASLNLGIDF
jgi:iron complex outermembrane receptor protein